jgi:hypothetical protein
MHHDPARPQPIGRAINPVAQGTIAEPEVGAGLRAQAYPKRQNAGSERGTAEETTMETARHAAAPHNTFRTGCCQRAGSRVVCSE